MKVFYETCLNSSLLNKKIFFLNFIYNVSNILDDCEKSLTIELQLSCTSMCSKSKNK